MIAILRKNKVYNLFKEFFGEDRIDLRGNDIIVWWPKLRVSNELGQSCIITHLYARVPVENNGTMGGVFGLNRTEYSYGQWIANYCHSHVNSIYKSRDSLRCWKSPCLGQGPIRRTISSLTLYFDEDLWNLFCFELDQYVRHESVVGVPYIRLERIGIAASSSRYIVDIPKSHISYYSLGPECDEFMKKSLISEIIAKKPFRFNYIEGNYTIAENPIDLIVKVSDIFIGLYNRQEKEKQQEIMDKLKSNSLFSDYKIVNNRLFMVTNRNETQDLHMELEGIPILKFKGEEKHLVITDKENGEEKENVVKLLSPPYVMYILNKILRIINYRFNGKDKERASSTKEAIKYL